MGVDGGRGLGQEIPFVISKAHEEGTANGEADGLTILVSKELAYSRLSDLVHSRE